MCRNQDMQQRTLALIAAVAGFFLGVDRASAQTCMQEVWQAHGNSQGLTCTANDVTLSSVSNVCIVVTPPGGPTDLNSDGCKDAPTCNGGQPFTFSADYTMPLTAQDRYDLGLYIATDGGGADGALTGLCANNVLTATNSPTFDQNDAAPDLCGDIANTAASNPQVFRQTITTMCNASGGSQVTLPFCTSWRQPGSNQICDSTTFTTAASWDAFPGSPSKCNCGTVTIPVFTETASIAVTKTVSPTTVSEIGGSVQFTVSVTNNADVSDVTLDSLEDLIPSPSGTNIVYGDLLNPSSPITATTCDDSLPIVIAAGQTFTCTFDVTLGPGDTGDSVTDTVEACGTDDFGHTDLCANDPATVTYTDQAVDPDLDKTASLNAVQVDVNFAVVVTNNSTVDTLTVNTLTDDKFGNITTAHAAGGGFSQVVSTTCATGGTIPPNDGAGPNVNMYSCSFVGRILSTGLHVDKVNGTATDDDSFTYPGVCVNSDCLEDTAQVNISVTFP